MGSDYFEYDKVVYYRFDGERKQRMIQKLASLLVADDRVKLAYIFGSFAGRNNVRDIDLAIYSAPALSFGELLKFGSRMELELGIPVDLVQLQDLPPAFKYKVLRHGLPVVTKDKQLAYSLVTQASSEMFDLAQEMPISVNRSKSGWGTKLRT